MSTREYVMLCTGFAFDGEVGRVKTAGSVAQRILSQRSCNEDEEEGKYFLVADVGTNRRKVHGAKHPRPRHTDLNFSRRQIARNDLLPSSLC